MQEQRMSSRPSTRSREKIFGSASTLRDIAEALKTCTALEGMTVHGIKTCGTAGADALAEALAHHTSLVRLQLNCHKYADTGVHAMIAVAKALQINTTLMCLDFGAIRCVNESMDAGAIAISEALVSNTTLTDLIIMGGGWYDDRTRRNSRIGPKGSTALAEGLKVNPSLRRLCLRDNASLGEAGVTALSEALLYNTSLTKLEVDSCDVGDRGTTSMANALKVNTSLTFLNMSSCGIGTEGSIAMAKALQTNASIMRLNLDYNRSIGDGGAVALGEALVSNTSLSWFSLRHTNTGSRGVTAFAKALRINTTLQHLDLHYTNELDDGGAKAFGEALDVNSSLTWLALPNLRHTLPGARIIGTAWGNNCALCESLKIEFGGLSEFYPSFAAAESSMSVMHKAREYVVWRREQLLAFGMAMLPRLGGGGGSVPQSDQEQASAGCPFYRMQPDIFRMVGDAY